MILPWLFLPACFGSGANNDFSGLLVVISAKSNEVMLRRPLVIALYTLIAICHFSSLVVLTIILCE